MKKIIGLVLCVLLVCTCFAGCGKKAKYDRENLINGTSELVELCNIESFEFSASDEDYKKLLSSIIESDLSNSAYAKTIKEGIVEEGDITNIDYAGSVDGVAFTGGTAKNQELTIGSGQFIDGFEDQLIGVKIGDTVTITVMFPDGYNDSTDLETGKTTMKLANQEAQFEVKINSVKRPFTEVNDEFAVAAGFENAEKYNEEAEKTALKNSVYSYLMDNSEILDYPEEDEGTPYTYFKNYYTSYAQQQGGTFEDFLSYNSLTEAQFKQDILKEILIMYACFDKLELSLEEGAVDEKVKELAEQYSASEEEITEYYTKAYIESQLVVENVLNALIERTTLSE